MQAQTFNDGVVNIYLLKNIAKSGDLPKDGLNFKIGPLHYQEKTVGMSRYWTAKQANTKVSQLLRVPRFQSVNTDDVAIPNDGSQYKIVQIQYPENVYPPVMDLSLERVDVNYDFDRS